MLLVSHGHRHEGGPKVQARHGARHVGERQSVWVYTSLYQRTHPPRPLISHATAEKTNSRPHPSAVCAGGAGSSARLVPPTLARSLSTPLPACTRRRPFDNSDTRSSLTLPHLSPISCVACLAARRRPRHTRLYFPAEKCPPSASARRSAPPRARSRPSVSPGGVTPTLRTAPSSSRLPSPTRWVSARLRACHGRCARAGGELAGHRQSSNVGRSQV